MGSFAPTPVTGRRWSSSPILGGAAAVLLLLLLSLAKPCSAQSSSVSISPPTDAPSDGLSLTLSAASLGMGIEPSNLLSFTGTDSANPITYKCLANLATYADAPPHLRIGGNSGDNMLYNAQTTGYGLVDNPSSSGAGYDSKTDRWYIGPGYFQAIDRFPPNTPITYGLNLAYNGGDSMQRIVALANASLSLKNVKVVGFEIGNEPDLYTQLGYRPASWTATDYGNEWASAAQTLYNQVLKPKNLPINFFETAATATTATASGHAFRISNLVNTGVAAQGGSYVAAWNQHDYLYYVGVSQFQITRGYVLDLGNTVSQFTEWRNQAQDALVTGKPYKLREMNSIGPTGIQSISDAFANTLWTLNFFLYVSTLQVSSVQFHLTGNSYSSPWQPDGDSPHVRSTYYAYAALFQIIGTKCNARVGSININGVPGNYNNHLAAYSVYRGKSLGSIVLINTQEMNQGTPSPPSVSFTVSLPAYAGRTVYLSTLTADGTDATQNTTWNGMSYESTGTSCEASNITAQPANSPPQQQITIGADGSLTIPVRDGQAVVANLDRVLGSDNSVDQAACAALASGAAAGGDATTTGAGGGGGGKAPLPTFRSTTGFKTDGQQLGTEAIVGIAVGAFGLFFLIGFAAFLCCCCRNRKRAELRKGSMPLSYADPSAQEHGQSDKLRPAGLVRKLSDRASAAVAGAGAAAAGAVARAAADRRYSAQEKADRRSQAASPLISGSTRPSGDTYYYDGRSNLGGYQSPSQQSHQQHRYVASPPPAGHGPQRHGPPRYVHVRHDSSAAASNSTHGGYQQPPQQHRGSHEQSRWAPA